MRTRPETETRPPPADAPDHADGEHAATVRWRPLARMPLFWRVFATNALVLSIAAMALALSPATVSFPLALAEAAVLAAGLGAMVALNFALLRRALLPLERLREAMRGADLLRPGARVPVEDVAPELRAVTETFNEMVERLEAERRESASRTLMAQEGERRRIARELHDEVGQKLTGAMLQLEALSRSHSEPELDDARDVVRESLGEVRVIARRLRPEALDDLGLQGALGALADSLHDAAGIGIDRQVEPSLPPLAPEEELVIYRVAQEALTNAARHARCDEVRLALRRKDGAVMLEVADSGQGFDLDATPAGVGITGMRERALLAGAELDLEVEQGSGTTVRLTVPVADRG